WPGDQDHEQNRDRQQVILKSLASLVAHPVHEEPNLAVDHPNRTEHDDNDRRCGKPRQEPNHEPQTTKELTNRHEITQRSHHSNNRRQPRSTKCSEELLRAVRHKHHTHNDARNQQRHINRRSVMKFYFSYHDLSLSQNLAHLPVAIIFHRLINLLTRVHHEWPI